jgi:hypothetical protein
MGLVSTTDPEVPVPVGLKDEMRSGIGLAWPESGISLTGNEHLFQGIFEYISVTFIGAGSLNDVIQSPSDLTAGLRYLNRNRDLTFNILYISNSYIYL